jgi:hypothetical protein
MTLGNGRQPNILAEVSMNNNAALLDTLLQQAESAARRHSQHSRLTRQAINRQLERTDSETVARQLDAIYQYRASRLPAPWRVAQQLTMADNPSW